MEKLRKTAGKLDTFFRILFWILVIVAAAMAILSIWQLLAFGLGRETFASLDLNIILGDFILTADQFSGNDYAVVWGMVSVLNVVFSAFILYSISIIRSILQPMKEGHPFEKMCSQEIKKLAWVSVLYAVIYQLLTNGGRHSLSVIYMWRPVLLIPGLA